MSRDFLRFPSPVPLEKDMISKSDFLASKYLDITLLSSEQTFNLALVKLS